MTARQVLDHVSTSSCLRSLRVRVAHTPCVSASSTMSYRRRPSLAIWNDAASRGAAVLGFVAIAVADDDIADSKWMWMVGQAICERIVSPSIRSSTARIARTISAPLSVSVSKDTNILWNTAAILSTPQETFAGGARGYPSSRRISVHKYYAERSLN